MRRRSVMSMQLTLLAALVAAVMLGCKDDRFVPMEWFVGSKTSPAQPNRQ